MASNNRARLDAALARALPAYQPPADPLAGLVQVNDADQPFPFPRRGPVQDWEVAPRPPGATIGEMAGSHRPFPLPGRSGPEQEWERDRRLEYDWAQGRNIPPRPRDDGRPLDRVGRYLFDRARDWAADLVNPNRVDENEPLTDEHGEVYGDPSVLQLMSADAPGGAPPFPFPRVYAPGNPNHLPLSEVREYWPAEEDAYAERDREPWRAPDALMDPVDARGNRQRTGVNYITGDSVELRRTRSETDGLVLPGDAGSTAGLEPPDGAPRQTASADWAMDWARLAADDLGGGSPQRATLTGFQEKAGPRKAGADPSDKNPRRDFARPAVMDLLEQARERGESFAPPVRLLSPREQAEATAGEAAERARGNYSGLSEDWGWLDLTSGFLSDTGQGAADVVMSPFDDGARNRARERGERWSRAADGMGETIVSDATLGDFLEEWSAGEEARRAAGQAPFDLGNMDLIDTFWRGPARHAREARGEGVYRDALADFEERDAELRLEAGQPFFGSRSRAERNAADDAFETDAWTTGSGALELIPGVGLIDIPVSLGRAGARAGLRAAGQEVPEMLARPARLGETQALDATTQTGAYRGDRNAALGAVGVGAGYEALDGEFGDDPIAAALVGMGSVAALRNGLRTGEAVADGALQARRLGEVEPIDVDAFPVEGAPDAVARPADAPAPTLPARNFQAAIRDPETGQVYVGMDHLEAIDSAPDAARARLEAIYEAPVEDAASVGFVVNGQFMGREEGLAAMRASRDQARSVRIGEQVNRDGSVTPATPIDYDAPDVRLRGDLGMDENGRFIAGAGAGALGGAGIGSALNSEAEAQDGGQGDPLDDLIIPILGAGGGAATIAAMMRGRGPRRLGQAADEAVRVPDASVAGAEQTPRAAAAMAPDGGARGPTDAPTAGNSATPLTDMFGGSVGMFGGVHARTADRGALERAQAMASSGATRDDIWRETGWFQGVDGKWRFEIDDSGARIAPDMLERHSAASVGSSQRRPLTEGMQHDELYDAYNLDDTTLDFGRLSRGAVGEYDNSRRSVGMYAADDPDMLRSGTLHETQHRVQREEGFATGGTPESAWGVNEQASLDAIRAQKKAALGGRDPYAIQNRIAAGYRVSDEDMAALEQWRELTRQEDSILANTLSPREAYRRLAGETEARNVQTRRDFTPEERRARPPWETQDVPDDQQIIRFDGGVAESRPARLGDPLDGVGEAQPPVGNLNRGGQRRANEGGTEADFLAALPTNPEQWREAQSLHPWMSTPARAQAVIMASARDQSGRFIYSVDDILAQTRIASGNSLNVTLTKARDAGIPVPLRPRGQGGATRQPGGARINAIVELMERTERQGAYLTSSQIAQRLGMRDATAVESVLSQVRNGHMGRQVPDELLQRLETVMAARDVRRGFSLRKKKSDAAGAVAGGIGIGAGGLGLAAWSDAEAQEGPLTPNELREYDLMPARGDDAQGIPSLVGARMINADGEYIDLQTADGRRFRVHVMRDFDVGANQPVMTMNVVGEWIARSGEVREMARANDDAEAAEEDWWALGRPLVSAAAGVGLGSRLRNPAIGATVAGGSAAGIDLMLGGDEAEPYMAAAVGAGVRGLGARVADDIGAENISRSPEFIARRAAFLETLPNEPVTVRGSAAGPGYDRTIGRLETDRLIESPWETPQRATITISGEEIAEQGFARELAGGQSPRERFLEMDAREQLAIMDSVAAREADRLDRYSAYRQLRGFDDPGLLPLPPARVPDDPLAFPVGFFDPATGQPLYGDAPRLGRRPPPRAERRPFDQLSDAAQARRIGKAADQIEAARDLGAGEFKSGAAAMRALRERANADPAFMQQLIERYPSVALVVLGGGAVGAEVMSDGDDPLGGIQRLQ